METEANKEIAEATEIVKNAIEEYGVPVWIVKIPFRVRRLVPADVKTALLAGASISEGWAKDVNGSFVKGRPDNRSIVLAWAKEHLFEEVTTKQIAEMTGVPLHAVRSVVSDRPDVFRSSEGWTYEIRDPQADRKAGKQ